ncbi:hypothetical protein [Rickettsia endosymbiont of Halotydeus destructor]|uniref:hypothetical protein n=1 Tax=Rickettsia endosymbiont of Halotydeus destructor TaxID=2996754 RepID=UPI003BAF48B3
MISFKDAIKNVKKKGVPINFILLKDVEAGVDQESFNIFKELETPYVIFSSVTNTLKHIVIIPSNRSFIEYNDTSKDDKWEISTVFGNPGTENSKESDIVRGIIFDQIKMGNNNDTYKNILEIINGFNTNERCVMLVGENSPKYDFYHSNPLPADYFEIDDALQVLGIVQD